MPTHGSNAAEVAALAGQLPAGLRVAAGVPGRADADPLHPLEALLMRGESGARRQQFAAGRGCAHTLLADLAPTPAPLLRRRDGTPDWPAGVRGSISHKTGLCVVLAGRSADHAGIGIDLEACRALPAPVWGRVFTAAERDRLDRLSPAPRAITARLWFSAKECYYKWYRSQGGERTPDFGDVDVHCAGSTLRLRPRAAAGLPDAAGCFVRGERWLITALWSPAPDRQFYQQTFNSPEVDHHGYTHRPTVHA